ncbi:MAG: hypothetical protein NC299_07155 [Lachnospiraceae bacterium]|nr:hypothetical protein [Ruminococcus sp.]MCM1275132.1 hypothetical protein [Lachnospiraceae bacterium]
MAENNDKRKKKPNKGKTAFMFAFAVTVLSSRAASLAASATTVPTDDFDDRTTDSTQKETGTGSAYQKVGGNVFVATEHAHTAHNFTKELHEVRNYGVFTKTLNSPHTEANVAADSTGSLDVFNSNMASKGTNGNGVYTCYLGSVPTDTTTIKLTIAEDTEYELVLGFDFTPDYTLDNGHKMGFWHGGVLYEVECGGKTDKVKLTRSDSSGTYITDVRDSIASAGQDLIDDKDLAITEDNFSALYNAKEAIARGEVQSGQTMVVNVRADELTSDTENLNDLLVGNDGVKIIINVVTDENTESVDFGQVTHEDWLKSGANVTFNFGSYTGTITTNMNAGNFVAPYATFTVGGDLSGSIVAENVTLNNEVHQVTSADSDADNVEEKDDEEEKNDENGDVEENPETPDVPDTGDEFEGDTDTDSDADVGSDGDSESDTDTDTDTDSDSDESDNGGEPDETAKDTDGDEGDDPFVPGDDDEPEGDTDSDSGDDNSDDDDNDGDDDTDPVVPPVVDEDGDDGDEPDEPDEPETPDVPDEPETPDVPEEPETPDVPDEPETPDVPDEPETPDVPDEPETPDVPDEPETPDVPDEPETPDVPEEPETPDVPDEPETPDVPDEPETPDVPDEPETPDVPDEPETPDVPDEPETPDVPDEPDTPDVPEEPETPDVPDEPETPDVPDEPDTPDVPEEPETPDVPEEPETPDVPDEPETPDVPDEPETPDVPDEPETPDVPDEPETPDVPDEPETPDVPDEPETVPGDDLVIEDFEMIPDDDVPLGAAPVDDGGVDIGGVEIPDDDVPLGANPYTGVVDHTAGLTLGAAGAAIALGLSAKRRGKKDDE